MSRSLLFTLYHLLLVTLILAAQAGCTSMLRHGKGSLADDPLLASSRSESLTAAIAKGLNYERSGQYDKARDAYEQALRDYPGEVEPLHRLAVLADKQRRHDEAQALYTRSIQMQPRNGELFNDLGYSFYLSGQLAKAESALVKAVSLEPTNPRYRNNLGMVIGQQGRLQEAFEQFATAGSEADAHYNMAFIHASRNQIEEAKACFLRALAVDPAHSKASKALESFRRFEQNGGQLVDEDYTVDGRPLVPYIETENGTPDIAAMTNFGIQHQVDSVLPNKHNFAQNRTSAAPSAAN